MDGASSAELGAAAREIQRSLNPHPGGQRELNVPYLDGEPVLGVQHKYAETVLCFPAPCQTCQRWTGRRDGWRAVSFTGAAQYNYDLFPDKCTAIVNHYR